MPSARHISRSEAAALRSRLRAFRRHTGLGTSEICRATGMTWPGLHYICNGRRECPDPASRDTLVGFMESYLRSNPMPEPGAERDGRGRALVETAAAKRCAPPEHFVHTQGAKVVTAALDYCAKRKLNGAIFGDPGFGKSEAMRHWSSTTTHPHAVVFCRAYTSYSKLLQALGRVLDIEGAATTGDLDEAIHEELASRPKLVVVDEADMLNARTLDWLRTIWDESGHQSSFVLLAKPAFYSRLQVAHARSRQDLRQVWRRLAFRKFLSGITAEEMLAYLAEHGLAGAIEPAAAEALHAAAAGSFGDLAMLVEIVRQTLEENPRLQGRITAAVVAKAAEVRFGADIGRRR